MADPLADSVLLADPEPIYHARRRFSTSSQKARAQHAANSPDLLSAADPDTCRICRGEATDEEPLFYPCKCSGSIKFVHQNCLMEWLSHSQKKHCELCKTPFRFTKLYDRRMPQTLPMAVFVSHVAKYLFNNMLGWLRAALVVSMWLVCLPYLMRSIWSLMFWISDEGFGGGGAAAGPLHGLGPAGLHQGAQICAAARDVVISAARAVCPSTPLLAPFTATGDLPRGRFPDGSGSNAAAPLYAQVLHLILSAVGLADDASTRALQAPPVQVLPVAPPRQPAPQRSLLGDVAFFNSITPLPWLNRNLIYVAEGQVITVLVIICFILIILVRDYVVLQQPEINMRAAFAAAENQAPRGVPLADPAAGLRAEDIDALRGPDPIDFGDDSDDETASMDSDRAQDGSAVQAGNRRVRLAAEDYVPVPIPPYRRRLVEPAPDNGEESSTSGTEPAPAGEALPANVLGHGVVSHDLQDDDFAPVARPSWELVEPLSVREFTRVYHEAQGDSDEMARLFDERGLGARAEPWLKLRREKEARMQAARLDASSSQPSTSQNQPTPTADGSPSDKGGDSTTSVTEQEPASSRDSDQSSSDWTLPSDSAGAHDVSSISKGKEPEADLQTDPTVTTAALSPAPTAKGKEKAVEEASPAADQTVATRPRANTDGPLRLDGIHPLANNTWAFPPLDQAVSSSSAHAVPDDDSGAAEPLPSLAAAEAASEAAVAGQAASPGGQSVPTDVPAEGETPAWANLPDFNDLPAHDAAHDAQPQAHEERQPVGIMERLAEFMWRGVNPAAEGVEQRARVRAFLGDPNQEFGLGDELMEQDDHDGDNEARHGDHAGLEGAGVPVGGADQRQQQQRDADAVREAVAAGLDPEAIEDAEDFEGVMELLGMRGPIAGLFQNAVFCSFLVSVTVFAGIFVPYNIGRVCVWILANPTRPLRIIFSIVKLVQDCALVAAGMASWLALRVANMISPLLALQHLSQRYVMPLVRASYYMSLDAARRIVESFTVEPPVISTSEMRNFSAISHEALLSIKANVVFLLCAASRALAYVFGGDYSNKRGEVAWFVGNATSAAWDGLKEVPGVLADPGSWVINLSPVEAPPAVNPELAYWGGADRFWATLGGYLALCLAAGLYLHRGRPFSTSASGQEREASIVDGLNQASGVMKVILIIGIEMLIFPLYCGLLLDVALLPLFEKTTLRSRVLFTYNYPLTSIFVHWFVGTGYMFHFALFVSMCRKIMRKGVLYFIRDPDDPEFHPVRDVLERNVTTQLRKILFSAFVYGALVIVCLGGVVWGLWASLPGVLPIHYSSNEPVLEFPIDLLFYNFLMPLAVKFFRPSDGLHAMYTWWFRRCARALRVTWFLFGERRIDEEGVLSLGATSEARKLPFWRRLLLEVDDEAEVVPKRWGELFDMGRTRTTAEMSADELETLVLRKRLLVLSKQMVPDGRFVRTPASDQVKVPKGRRVFLDVTEANERTDGLPDGAADLYSGESYQLVYIPPHFRLRIFLFILSIWVFAAVTGVSLTIIPLIFGRRVFKMLIPAHIRTNDIYAFSIGIYILGSLAYALFHLGKLWASSRAWVSKTASAARDHAAARKAAAIATRAAKLVYCYFFLLVVFPLLVSSLIELYCLIPLDTYMYSALFVDGGHGHGGSIVHGPPADAAGGSTHTIRVIQAWTIGLLYLKLSARIVDLWYEESRPAAALRAIVAGGWLNPDAGVLTRAFIIPGLVLSAIAIAGPLTMAHVYLSYLQGSGNSLGDAATAAAAEAAAASAAAINPTLVYRLSFPVAALGVVMASMAWAVLGVFRSWRVRIRDEAYLIGERLHNFGASSSGPPPPTPGSHNHPRARVAWREGGAVAI